AAAALAHVASAWRRHDVETTDVQLRRIVQLIVAEHGRSIRDTATALATVAATPNSAVDDLPPFLGWRSDPERNPIFSNVWVTDPVGGLIGAHRAILAAQLGRLPSLARRAAESHTSATETVELDVPPRGIGLLVAQPAPDASRIVFGLVDTTRLREGVDGGLPPGALMTILDHDGRIVVRSPGGDGWIGRSFADDPFARAVIAGGSDGVARAASFDGVPRRFAYAALANAGGAPWHVTVGVPDAGITSVVDETIARTSTLLAVAVAVAIGLVVIACRRVESDARALVRSAQSLPTGRG